MPKVTGTISWDRFKKFWQKFTEVGITKGRGWPYLPSVSTKFCHVSKVHNWFKILYSTSLLKYKVYKTGRLIKQGIWWHYQLVNESNFNMFSSIFSLHCMSALCWITCLLLPLLPVNPIQRGQGQILPLLFWNIEDHKNHW